MSFQLPPRSAVGYLDPMIAGEGEKIQHSEGEPVSWNPPPTKPAMPDLSEVKSIKRYFNRAGYQPWPAWFYHPTEQAKLVNNADAGMELGVYYRMPTADETARYGAKTGVWDWQQGCEWRPVPYGAAKFDPRNPGQGKEFIDPMRDPAASQSILIRQLTQAVSQALGGNNGKPAHVDKAQWDEFLQFMAFKKAQEAIKAPDEPADAGPEMPAALREAVNALSGEPSEHDALVAQAKAKGIKVDGRWSDDRLKTEIAKAA